MHTNVQIKHHPTIGDNLQQIFEGDVFEGDAQNPQIIREIRAF